MQQLQTVQKRTGSPGLPELGHEREEQRNFAAVSGEEKSNINMLTKVHVPGRVPSAERMDYAKIRG